MQSPKAWVRARPRRRLAIAGFHEGLAGQVSSWVESVYPDLELVCFVHPGAEAPSVSDAARLDRASRRFQFPTSGTYRGLPLLHGLDWARQLTERRVSHVIPALPDARERSNLIKSAVDIGLEIPTVVHPSAVVLPGAQVERGSILEPQVYVGLDAEIGIGCHLHAGSQVDHNSVLSDFVTLNPRATVAGNVFIGSLTSINLSATVSNGVRLGEQIVVGAGAVVLKSYLEPGLRLFGVPARPSR